MARFANEMTQPGPLVWIALMAAFVAFLGIVFAERMKEANDKNAPWLRYNSVKTYRRFGYGFAILSLVCAVASLARFLSNT